MADRPTRTLQIIVPGGRTSPQSLADIIDTLFEKGIEQGERIESIRAFMGTMAETMTIEVVISVPAAIEKLPAHDDVDGKQQLSIQARSAG